MNKFKVLTIMSSMSLVSLTGCSILPMKSEFRIKLDTRTQNPYQVMVRSIPNSKPNCMTNKYAIDKSPRYQRHYFYYDRYCFEKEYFPETIVVEYAKWLSNEEEKKNGIIPPSSGYDISQEALHNRQMDEYYKKVDQDVAKIPASQWHRVVLHPQQLRAKYKSKTPEGNRYRPSGTIIGVNIKIRPDGTAEVTEYYSWRSTISPRTTWAR